MVALVSLVALVAMIVLRTDVLSRGATEPIDRQIPSAGAPDAATDVRRESVVRAPVPSAGFADLTSATLRVVDPRGVAIDDAGAWEDAREADWLKRSSASFLGATGPDGSVRIPTSSDGRTVQVGHPGFLTQRVRIVAGETHEVVLPDGGEVRFLCTYSGRDEPAAGIEVVVAGSGESVFPLRDAWPAVPADAVPAHPVERVVFRGRTGADGLVTIRGLPAGELAWCAWGEDCVLSDGPGLKPPDTTAVLAQGGQYELVFTRLAACGFRLISDTVVTSKAVPIPARGFKMSTLGGLVRSKIEEGLRAEYPESMVYVLPTETERSLRISLVLEQHGRHEFDLPFVPLAEFERQGPVTVDASTLLHEGTGSAALLLRVTNPGGLELAGVGGRLWAEDERMILRVESGHQVLVPHGRYRFLPEQEIVRNCLPRDGIVEVDATRDRMTVEFELTHALRPVIVIPPRGMLQCVAMNEDSGVGTVIDLGGEGEPLTVFLADGRRYAFRDEIQGAVLGRADLRFPAVMPPQVRLERPR